MRKVVFGGSGPKGGEDYCIYRWEGGITVYTDVWMFNATFNDISPKKKIINVSANPTDSHF
jgi:hypothetical protein